MDTLIEARNLSLRFSAPTDKKGSLKKWVLDAVRSRVRSQHFLAVDDVSFRIERGEAGRSTGWRKRPCFPGARGLHS